MPQHLTFDRLIRVGETVAVHIDYTADLTGDGGSDTISTSAWTVPTGTTNADDSFSGYITTLWLTGVTAGTKGVVVNTVVSNGGKTLKRSYVIRVIA